MRRAMFLWMGLAAMGLAGGVSAAGDANEECLACHGDDSMRDTRFEFANGSSAAIFVDARSFGASVHGPLDCVDCHGEFRDDHPSRRFKSRVEYRWRLSQACVECHGLEGPHLSLSRQKKPPACVDCHGAHTVKPIERGTETCLGCHDREIEIGFSENGLLRTAFDKSLLEESVHRKLRCVDCHFGFSAQEHPQRVFATRRDLSLAHAETCRRCHFDKYTMSLESVHSQVNPELRKAPACIDCHGGHGVRSGRHDKLEAARRCRNCHQVIYDVYAKSVHGEALLSADNQDVPVCSDCHTAHKIRHPGLNDFRNDIPALCGDCHANRELMSRYGLSTAVLDSYLQDFHGVTVSYYKKEESADRRIAVCTDCHGIHDIGSLRDRDSSKIVKATLLGRCRSCHADAGENFPDAWISHYQPTFARAPLVYSINLFYRIFIPFMVAGLILQIALHVWRFTVSR